MKDKVYDLVYNWKHSMSRENTKGTRGLCILIFVACALVSISGLGAIIFAAIAKNMIGLIIGLITTAVGIGLFAFMSKQ